MFAVAAVRWNRSAAFPMHARLQTVPARPLLRVFAACTFALGLGAPLAAETLWLKDGRVLQGRVVRHTRTAIMLELPDGRTLELPKSRIARMRFDNTTTPNSAPSAGEIQAQREAERRAAERRAAERRAAERRAAERRQRAAAQRAAARRAAEAKAAEAKAAEVKAAEELREARERERAAAEARAAEEKRQALEREREAAERLTLRTTPDVALPAPICLVCPAAPPANETRESTPLSWSAGLQLSRARTGLQALLPDAAITSLLAGQLPSARSADQLRYGALLLGLQYERPQWFLEFEVRGGDGEAQSTYAGAGLNERIQGLNAEHELGGASLTGGHALYAGRRATLYGFAGLDISAERARYASLGFASARVAGAPRDFLFLDPLFEDALESGVWLAGLEIRRTINANWGWRARHQFGYGAATFLRERASLGAGFDGVSYQAFYERTEGEAIVRSASTALTITRELDESGALDFTLARRRERYTFYDLRTIFASGANFYDAYGAPVIFQGPTVRAVERSVSARYRRRLDWR